MDLDEQIDGFEKDLSADRPPPDDPMLRRAIYLCGELDLSGATVNEILGVPVSPPNAGGSSERYQKALGRLGSLVGRDRETDAVKFSSAVAVTVETLT